MQTQQNKQKKQSHKNKKNKKTNKKIFYIFLLFWLLKGDTEYIHNVIKFLVSCWQSSNYLLTLMQQFFVCASNPADAWHVTFLWTNYMKNILGTVFSSSVFIATKIERWSQDYNLTSLIERVNQLNKADFISMQFNAKKILAMTS